LEGKLLGEDERFLSELEKLTEIDRYALVVKPQAPFLAWLKSVDDSSFDFTLEDLNDEAHVYLIPVKDDSVMDIATILKPHFKAIFEQELMAWWTAAADWPKPLTWTMFETWFESKLGTVVVDCGNRPIKREPLL
jgi:hypothetical protein